MPERGQVTTKPFTFRIHTDGGARGNPGPAAIGVIISGSGSQTNPGLQVRVRHSAFIGETTNNVAEYTAVREALYRFKEILSEKKLDPESVRVVFFLDSTLVVNQLNGTFKVKDPVLRELLFSIRTLEEGVGGISYTYVPRESNREADQLVNLALDKALYT
ncbi:hypothetical protein A2Z33_03015 [Candidatus Gottesmanbacteria bacterium RBG_16_52_11]|uniref:RNase H type-1 domain-containing protein n=1 Tax=Candidatus Gottesmanbacteria bacterium RBG_16_52_11 TaxID=1798374 RepID=A0A1F5YVB2_9BACT|nr:MAG: hypothetical protein A2Z33_03015 [Candidatus Gottesmanbacteria bacterium RBG_16_52_11]